MGIDFIGESRQDGSGIILFQAFGMQGSLVQIQSSRPPID